MHNGNLTSDVSSLSEKKDRGKGREKGEERRGEGGERERKRERERDENLVTEITYISNQIK